jgi:hypothetical protein
MLEDIGRLRRQPPLVQEFRRHQLVQPLLQGALVPGGDGLQQGIGKLASERGPELCQALHRCQAIEPRHQRVVQGGGNRQRRQEPGELIALLSLLEQPRLQHHHHQLLHKQRHPHKEHGLLSGDAQEDRQQGVQGLLLLLPGRPGEGGYMTLLCGQCINCIH